MALVVKNLPAHVGDIRDAGSVPGLEGSPGGGHGNPSSILAWRIPQTEEPCGWVNSCASPERFSDDNYNNNHRHLGSSLPGHLPHLVLQGKLYPHCADGHTEAGKQNWPEKNHVVPPGP